MGDKLDAASITYIVKALVTAAGFNAELYSGHSLRSGFVTAASAGGASDVSGTRSASCAAERTV